VARRTKACGHRLRRVRARTLIGDGAEDSSTAVANSGETSRRARVGAGCRTVPGVGVIRGPAPTLRLVLWFARQLGDAGLELGEERVAVGG
jgi:hypothetical protein